MKPIAYSKSRLADQLIGAKEAAEILGITPSTVTAYVARKQMLPPLVTLACGPIWLRDELERWNANRGRRAA